VKNICPEKLNKSQAAAAKASGFTFVRAGAGTGKTRILACRFVNVLADLIACGIPPEEAVTRIFAVTFTEKATAEMVARIGEMLYSLWRDTQALTWYNAYKSFDKAQISTIHSLCRGILARYPFKAGLTPGFDISPQALPIEELVRDFLEDSLKRREDLRDIVFFFIRNEALQDLRETIFKIFVNRSKYITHIKILANSDPAELGNAWKKLCISWFNQIKEEAKKIATELESFDGKAIANARELALTITESKFPLEETDISKIEEFKLSGSYKDPVKKGLIKRVKELKTNILSLANYELIDDYAYACVNLAKLYLEFEDFVWRGRDKASTLDYADLLILTRELVYSMGDEIVDDIVPHQLLVDEFQDISPLQWDILHWFFARCKGGLMVGDEKQSIYWFRGAEVETMRKGEKFATEKGFEPVELAENYRTSKGLLEDRLNKIFSVLFNPSENQYEPRHQELVSRRESAIEPIFEIIPYSPKNCPFKEYQLAARYVLSLLSGEREIFVVDEDSQQARRLHPGDIMVLTRKGDVVFNIIKELRQAGIAAVPLVERGFFDTEEVKTILSLMQFLLNPLENNGALFLLLVSNAFGLKPSEITDKLGINDKSLWMRLKIYAENAQDERFDPLCKAYKILAALIDKVDKLPPDKILDEFLFGYGFITALSATTGDTAFENIMKFLGMVKSASSGGESLSDIVEYLENIAQIGQIGYAKPLKTLDAVRVSTIHSAKGLEAPFVVVVESHGRKDDKVYLCPELEGAVFPKIKKLDNPIFNRAKSISVAKADAEEKRLFYVALTRAKDHLAVICKNNNTYYKWFFENPVKEGVISERDYQFLDYEDLPPLFEPISEPRPAHIPTYWSLARKPVPRKSLVILSARQAAQIVTGIRFDEDYHYEMESGSLNWGSLVHQALSLAPFDSAESLKAIAEKIGEKSIYPVLMRFFNSEWHEILSKSDNKKEVQLVLRSGNLVVNGVADVVVFSPPMIWDYKTGGRNPDKELFYKTQVNFYRLALASELGIKPNEVKAYLLYIGDEIESVEVEFDENIMKNLEEMIDTNAL